MVELRLLYFFLKETGNRFFFGTRLARLDSGCFKDRLFNIFAGPNARPATSHRRHRIIAWIAAGIAIATEGSGIIRLIDRTGIGNERSEKNIVPAFDSRRK